MTTSSQRDEDRPGIIGVLKGAFVLALIASILSIPYFRFLARGFGEKFSREGLLPGEIIAADVTSVFAVSFLSSMIGMYASRRYGLPGIGKIPREPRILISLIMGGILAGIISFFVFDRKFRELAPGYYPDSLTSAISIIPFSPVFDEVVSRFGLMTIFTGLLKSPLKGNIVSSSLLTLWSVAKAVSFAGITLEPFSYLQITAIILTLASNALFGYCYAWRGLVPSMILHLAMESKYLLCPYV